MGEFSYKLVVKAMSNNKLTDINDYRDLIDEQINLARNKASAGLANEKTINNSQLVNGYKLELNQIVKLVLPNLDLEPSDYLSLPPKNIANVDYALTLFEIARKLAQNPNEIALLLSEKLNGSKLIDKATATGPYLNLRLNDKFLIEAIENIISHKENYGHSTKYNGQLALVDFSSPNVAKPFGINHLRSTVVGEALSKLLEASGYTVLRDNHIGDWGTQFGNLLAAYYEYDGVRDFESLSIDDLNELYVRFSQDKKISPSLTKKGQEYFTKLEAGDPELVKLWLSALSQSLKEFAHMYKMLNVNFDTQIGEAYLVQDANELINKLSTQDLAGLVQFSTDSKAVVIAGEHPVVLRTGDGYCVYAARDLATISLRVTKFNPNLIVYVVGEEQASYFRSVFLVADKAGLTITSPGQKSNLEHVGFGLLLDSSGKKLSTRKGTSGKLEDAINALNDNAVTETKKRNPDMSDSEVNDIAQKVAVGALIWNDLKTDKLSSVRFDIDRMLELGGDSIVDILYSYSRTCSILNKLDITSGPLPDKFTSEIEHQIAVRLAELENVVSKAMSERAPHLVANYLRELSQLHGRFYESSRVIGVDDVEVYNLRVALHKAYKQVIENGLKLLNIPLTDHL